MAAASTGAGPHGYNTVTCGGTPRAAISCQYGKVTNTGSSTTMSIADSPAIRRPLTSVLRPRQLAGERSMAHGRSVRGWGYRRAVVRPKQAATSMLCVLLLTCALCGCSRAAAVPRFRQRNHASSAAHRVAAAAGLTVHRVNPSTTGATVGAPNDPHIAVVDPGVRSNGELLVFLPGTGGRPNCCRYILDAAAEAGFHAIGLTYANATAVATICRNDLACYGTVRQDDFDGSEPNPFVHVAANNAIQARLGDLLRYLSAHYASERWSQFVTGATPRWNRIVIAGHSQGGGDAAYIGKIRKVEGVVMLSSDVDSSSTRPPVAADLSDHGPLDSARSLCGLRPRAGSLLRQDRHRLDRLDLQSFGRATSIDGHRTPFGGSHELLTSVAVPPGPAPALATHDSTAVDSQTPLCANRAPAFVPVWRYLMQVAGGLPVTKGVAVCPAG